MYLHNFFQIIHSALVTGATESGGPMGGCSFGISYPSMYHHGTEGKFMLFLESFRSRRNFTIWNLVFALLLRILLKPRTFSFRSHTNTAKAVSQLRGLKERKKLVYLANEGSGLSFFSMDLGHLFGSNVDK